MNKQEEQLRERMESHLREGKPLFGQDSPFSELLQGMVNQMLEAEMEVFQIEERSSGKKNKRNGKLDKSVRSSAGQLQISTPRDRNGDFSPQVVGKRDRSLGSGVDEQILALYAQGNSVEDIRRLLTQLYGLSMSAGHISAITDQILPQVTEWQSRQLQMFYPVIYLDAIHFKVRYEGRYEQRAFYTVYAVDWMGQRDVLGLYVQAKEGASRWGLVLEDLKQRGVQDILVVCTDDLTGFSEVISEVFGAAVVQKCIVHQVRNSLKYVDDKDRKAVAKDLRQVYTSSSREQAQIALDAFAVKWSAKYAYIAKQWQQKWDELMAYMDFPVEMRRMIYTTNPVEALHRIMRKIVKSKAAWVSDTALIKQLYLALMHNEKSWKKNARGWKSIQRKLLELYPERIKKYRE